MNQEPAPEKQPVPSQDRTAEARNRLLALRLLGVSKKPQSQSQPHLQSVSGRGPRRHASLSSSQHQMWLLDKMTPGNPAYNIPVAYTLRGPLDVAALEESLKRVVARHELWRTRFCDLDGTPAQEIHSDCVIRIVLSDLSQTGDAERAAELARQTAREAATPFDLTRLPLLRVSLFRVAPQEHVLLLVVHHIIADGLSLSVLFAELALHYAAARAGMPSGPGPLAVQYADFADWQRHSLHPDEMARQIEYWRTQLGGGMPPLDLSVARPRPAAQPLHGKSVPFAISPTLAQKLGTLAARENCTFFHAVLAAFQILLGRFSRSAEVCVGTPVANRPLPEFQALLGNFLNVLALRGQWAADETFADLLRRTRQTVLDALVNKDVPFATLVERLHLRRDPGSNPVFQAFLQILPPVPLSLDGLNAAEFSVAHPFVQFDITLSIYGQPDGSYRGHFQYRSDMLDSGAVETIARSFATMLTAIAAGPDLRIAEIPTVPPDERERMLHEWNRTERAFPDGTTLQALFEEQARRTPDAPAVECGGEVLSYRALDDRATRLAGRLRALGVRRDVAAGISTSRSADFVMGVLAILKAGGAFVPIDPAYPAERRAFVLEDSGATALLMRRGDSNFSIGTQIKTVFLDEADAPSENTAPAESGGAADSLAYIIHTSGSTGRPKGVAIMHRGVCNMVDWQIRFFQITEGSRVLQFASPSFDASVSEIFTALCSGATLVMMPKELGISPHELAAFLRDRSVTHATFPPSLLTLLPTDDLPGLRTVISAGEACPAAVVQRWARGRRFINAYGPTEASVCASAFVCDGSECGTPPVGKPIQNSQFYVLDDHLQPVPAGVPGELHIGGVGLARGYLNMPQLTAEKFIRNPFSDHPGARIYKTGDLCRWHADGNVECLGRVDQQVKIRGFRIEPGEIESVLRLHPGVRDAAVIARGDAPDERKLAAYIVTASSSEIFTADLRRHLQSRLPDYMVPTAFVFLGSLPLNTSGKVDRRALPAPERRDAAIGNAAPRTELEALLCTLWQEILKIGSVGIHDNFFEAGGDSLSAMKIITRLRGARFPNVNAGLMFEHPTVAALACALEASDAGEREEGLL